MAVFAIKYKKPIPNGALITVNQSKNEKVSFWFHIIFPVTTLWKRDKTYLLIFLVVNLIAGQIGVLTSIMLAWQGDGSIFNAWMQNLSSAALYTFSISLVVSSLALVGSELIDAIRFQTTVRYLEHKIIWSAVAAALLLFQAPLAGALLSRTDQSTLSEQHIAVAKSYTAPQQDRNTTPPVDNPKNTSKPLPGESRQQAEDSTQSLGTTPSNEINSIGGQSIQMVLWIVSMLTALILFCLYRIPLVTDKYAVERNKDVQKLAQDAANEDATSFGEAI